MTEHSNNSQTGTGNSGARNSVLVQAGILAAASMIVRVIGLLYRAPLTAIIGDVGNGLYGTAYNIYTIILMVSSYSVPSAISKMIAQKLAVGDKASAQRVYYCALLYGLVVGVIGSAILFFGAGILVPSNAVPVLRVFAPIIFLFGILGSLRGYFQGHGSMVETSISQILEQLANAVVSIGAAWLLMHLAAGASEEVLAERGAMGSALGTGAGVLVALLFVLWRYLAGRRQTRQNTTPEEAGVGEPMGRLFKETILVITPFMLSGVILNLTTSLNQTIYYKIIIGAKGLAEMDATTLYGIFSNKAVVISNIPISIATAVASAIIPGISAAYARGDAKETRRRASNAIRITAMIAIPSAVGLMALSRGITMLMFPQRSSLDLASQLLAMVGVTVVFYSIGTVTNAVLQSIGHMSMPLISAGIALVVQTIVLVVMLYATDLGIYVLALVSILYSAMIFTVNELCIRRFLGPCVDYRRMLLQPLGCAVVMGIAASAVYMVLTRILSATGALGDYFVNLLATLPAILVAVVIYAYMMIRTGCLDEAQLRSLPKGETLVRAARRLHWMK